MDLTLTADQEALREVFADLFAKESPSSRVRAAEPLGFPVPQLRAELRLQQELRSIGFTTRWQALRNIVVRGGYRLIPLAIRRAAYRRVFVSVER